jgi:hypothetical protein
MVGHRARTVHVYCRRRPRQRTWVFRTHRSETGYSEAIFNWSACRTAAVGGSIGAISIAQWRPGKSAGILDPPRDIGCPSAQDEHDGSTQEARPDLVDSVLPRWPTVRGIQSQREGRRRAPTPPVARGRHRARAAGYAEDRAPPVRGSGQGSHQRLRDKRQTDTQRRRAADRTSPDLRTLLETQRKQRDALRDRGKICPWVFHESGGQVRSFRWSWEKACRAAGCPGRLLHDFRRTAVRNLVRAGVPERVAMQMTGHKTRSVFERYNIVSSGDLRSAARRLDEARAEEVAGTIAGTKRQPAGRRRQTKPP